MRINEVIGTAATTAYHGDRKPLTQLTSRPLYCVEDFDFAASYARHRRTGGTPTVTELRVSLRNPAHHDDLMEILEELDIDPAEDSMAALAERPPVVAELLRRGFDSVIAYDFGFRSDFEELLVMLLLDPPSQATIVGHHAVEA